jgi:hypothetical protein
MKAAVGEAATEKNLSTCIFNGYNCRIFRACLPALLSLQVSMIIILTDWYYLLLGKLFFLLNYIYDRSSKNKNVNPPSYTKYLLLCIFVLIIYDLSPKFAVLLMGELKAILQISKVLQIFCFYFYY